MRIIVRSSGERTRDECIRLAQREGDVDVIEGVTPFSEALRETYRIGMTYDQQWIPVVDADVLLYQRALTEAVERAQSLTDVFCWDGKTDDKILTIVRRAGIHIYYRPLLEQAIELVPEAIKPETHTREAMAERGYRTHVGELVFGWHDYEQYYRDLWRKSYLQVKKLGGKVPRHAHKWKRLAKRDDDYRVIAAAHKAGKRTHGDKVFDASINYGAEQAIAKLGLEEKGPYVAV